MEIIGEKINGTRKRVAGAIAERDGDFIQDLEFCASDLISGYFNI